MKAVVLVGKSKRLRDKHTVNIAGKTLLERAVTAVASAGLDPVIYTRVPVDTSFGVEVLADISHDIVGAVRSVLSLMEARGEEAVFVFGGDMPFIDGGAVKRMISLWPGFGAVVPRWSNGYLEPLHAIYGTSLWRNFRPGIGLNESIRLMADITYVPAEEMPHHTFFNINTQEDLARAEEILAHLRKGSGANRPAHR